MLTRLMTAYRNSVQPRMAALPMYNPNLEIEAVGFEQRAGRLGGVLITPWCMTLVLLANEEDTWGGMASGETVEVDLPAGRYSCMLSMIDGIVPHLSLPLFTTVQDFPDQDTARQVALEILRRLYAAAADNADADEGAWSEGRTRGKMTRRELLRGFGARP